MKRDEIQQLLGGYATGTLTAEEREALFAAALEDQRLFEALLAEEPIREALQDPAARAALLAALDVPAPAATTPQPWYYRDVHPGIIAASVSAILLVTAAVEFYPVRVAPPINVVARPELPQFAKSVLPSALPPSQLPEAPAIPAVPNTPGIAAARRALDQLVVAQNTPAPQPPVELARNTVAPRAALFRQVAPAAPQTLRYTILRKTPNGSFVPIDPRQQLDPKDETLLRFEPSESGYVYVLERSGGAWRRIATEQVTSSAPYTVPREGAFHDEGTGPREFQVVFSREPQAAPDRVLGVLPVAGEPVIASAPPVTLFITLRYPRLP